MAMSAGTRTGPSVSIVTSHGRQQLAWRDGERMVDLLQRSGVPWSAVSIYVRRTAGGDMVLTPCLDAIVSELERSTSSCISIETSTHSSSPSAVTRQSTATIRPGPRARNFYQRLDNAASGTETFLKRLSPEECRSIIADRVADTIVAELPRGTRLVVGVSGGGDSNALLQALSRLRDHVTVDGVIIKGIPDWDKGVPRAQTLCEAYRVPLTIMEEDQVKALLGLPPDSLGLIDRFEREFKGDDFEFLGTLLIRLALLHRARAIGTAYACTGLNLEDLLCENLFRVSNGMAPATVPTRAIGDLTLVFPLWLCPKRNLDGCFPKLSLENYDARYPCFSLGRNLYYSVVYAMQSQFPGFMEQWARGLSTLSQKDPVTYTYDEQLGFHVERFVPFALRQKFLRMLSDAAARA